jgi:sulfoxide reductase heme-binding subunit YedZ
MHLTASPVDWYAARAAGIVAYVLLTAVVSLGLTMSSKRRLERWPRFALEDVHRFGGILVGVFVSIHVLTIAIDSYLRFSVAALVVPFVSTYRPIWTACGIVAAELLLALAVTNKLRDRMPYARWRLFHYANFAVWTAATVHSLAVGTDRSTVWLVAMQAVAVALVVGLTARRVRSPALHAGFAAASAGILAVVLAEAAFPFHTRLWNARRFHDHLAGVVSRDAGPSRELVSVAATGDGQQRVLLRADLLVEPQGLLSTSFQLEFLPSGMRCSGRVTHVDPLGFEGRCRAADGTRRYVRAEWEEEAGAQFTHGTLDAHA